MSESNRIEYKLELTDTLEKEIVAFLNYREGGFVFIGIADNGEVKGVRNIDAEQLKIKDRLKNNILPSCMGLFDVSSEIREGKDVIKITVASGSEKPYYVKKNGMSERGCFIRIGSAAEPMPVKLIEDLFSKRTRNSIGKIKSNKQDLSFEQLKIYYEEKGKPLNNKFAKNLELTTESGQYNYVAYLMSDSNITSIKVAKYKGLTRVDLIESNEYGNCSLVKATKQVLDKIDLENKTFIQITSKERKETRLWNEIALREAIINAIVHNDYTSEVPPKFEIFDDRIEITSAGGLPAGLSKEEFFEGYSVPRNKEIMRIYKDLDLVEQLGSGVPRMLETYKEACFKFSDHFLRMNFPAIENIVNLKFEDFKQSNGGQIEKSKESKENLKGGQIEILSEIELAVFEQIKNNPKISREDISINLSVNEHVIQKTLSALKSKGFTNRVGGSRGYWNVLGGQIEKSKKSKKNLKGGQIEILSEIELAVFEQIKNNPKISRQDIAINLPVNEYVIQKTLSTLKSKGFTNRVGGSRGYWNVLGGQIEKSKESKKSKENLKGGQIEILSEKELTIIDQIRHDARVNREQLSVTLSVNKSVIQKYLESLKLKGVIERIGGTRGYWQINKAKLLFHKNNLSK